MNLISLLNAPPPYLEQIQYNFEEKDDAGFSALHYAALTMSFSWLLQVLDIGNEKINDECIGKECHISQKLSILSNHNQILARYIPALGKRDTHLENEYMPFGLQGYSPVHLLIYLIHHYSKATHIEKHNQILAISSFLTTLIKRDIQVLSIPDGNNVSVLEYLILLNCEKYVQYIMNYEIDDSFLPTLNEDTLEKLLEYFKATYKGEDKKEIISEKLKFIDILKASKSSLVIRNAIDCLHLRYC